MNAWECLRPGRIGGGGTLVVVGTLFLAALPALWGCGAQKKRERHPASQVELREVWSSSELPGDPAFGSFSPDGKQVAVQVISKKADGKVLRQQLWVVGEDSAKPLGTGPSDISPDWSPRSDEVVYLDMSGWKEPKGDAELMKLRDPGIRVVVADARTGDRHILKAPIGYYGNPRWSPDGRAVALGFDRAPAGSDQPEAGLLVIEADGQHWRVIPTQGALVPGRPMGPSWSADGTRALFLASSRAGGGMELWMAEFAGGNARRVASELPFRPVGAKIGLGRRAPYYLLAEDLAWPPGSKPESAILLRWNSDANQWEEVRRLSSEPGWVIGTPDVNADATGMTARTAKVSAKAHQPPSEVEILWWYHGQHGRLHLPKGTNGNVLSWSRDGKQIAVSETKDGKGRVVVYEFVKRK